MKEIRLTKEIRAVDPAGSNELVLEGMAIVYDTPTTIEGLFGSFTETIKRGALTGCDLSDVRLLYNHDANKIPLARTPKTLELKDGPAGLSFRAILPNTEEGRSVYEAVARGDLSGCSFGFTIPDGGDTWDKNFTARTITKIKKLYECSVVPFPAYPTTSVEARSAYQRGRAKDKARILINRILLKGY